LVFRSLYQAHAFNGDPYPGNYLFHGGGQVTFLDFGLVKKFSREELWPIVDMVRCLCLDNDPEAFRRATEDVGFLLPACPVLADQSAGCPFGHRPKRRLARWRAPTKLCVTPSPWAMASDRITADKHL
jgi:hypothetical protein